MIQLIFVHVLIVILSGQLKFFAGYAGERPAVEGGRRKTQGREIKSPDLERSVKPLEYVSIISELSLRCFSAPSSDENSLNSVVICVYYHLIIINSSSKHTM